MLDVTYDKAKASFQKAFPSRTVRWLTHHSDFWYILAPDKDPDEGSMNPYFKVDDKTGVVSEFYVVQDLSLFQTILAQVTTKQVVQ